MHLYYTDLVLRSPENLNKFYLNIAKSMELTFQWKKLFELLSPELVMFLITEHILLSSSESIKRNTLILQNSKQRQ